MDARWVSDCGNALSRGHAPFWIALTACVLGIKVAILFLDPLPLFFLGDSGVYLSSAVSSSMPIDRSFTYGSIFIRPILALFGTLEAVVAIQSLLAGATSLLAAACLRIGFRAPLWVAATAALAYAVEPLALIHERLILTENLALFFIALFVLTGLAYINRPSAPLLILLALFGTCALSLRTFFIPVVLIATLAAVVLGVPHLRQQSGSAKSFRSRLLLHVGFAVAATIGFHSLYKAYFSYATGEPPSYNSRDGSFLLASWAPLVTANDFPNKAVGNHILQNLKFDLHNRFNRPAQLFLPGGLTELLLEQSKGNQSKANSLAMRVALNAGRRNPLGIVSLAQETYTDFWVKDRMITSILVDEGQRELDKSLIDYFKSHYDEDISQSYLRYTIIKMWHRAGIYWYRLLLLTPVISLLLSAARTYRRPTIFVTVIVCVTMVVACSVVTEAVVRYLHALAWLACIQFGIALCLARDFVSQPPTFRPAADPVSNQAARSQ